MSSTILPASYIKHSADSLLKRSVCFLSHSACLCFVWPTVTPTLLPVMAALLVLVIFTDVLGAAVVKPNGKRLKKHRLEAMVHRVLLKKYIYKCWKQLYDVCWE